MARKSIQIISNTPEIQAVKHSGLGICQVVFHKTGEIQVSKKLIIGSDSEGVIMLKTDGQTISEISVSDPSRKLGKIHLSLSIPVEKSGENFNAAWNDEERCTQISIELPRGNFAGKSVTLDLSSHK